MRDGAIRERHGRKIEDTKGARVHEPRAHDRPILRAQLKGVVPTRAKARDDRTLTTERMRSLSQLVERAGRVREILALTGRDIFLQAGGEHFDYVPALNGRSDHAGALARLIARSCADWPGTADAPSLLR